jgi:hypothetical protein
MTETQNNEYAMEASTTITGKDLNLLTKLCSAPNGITSAARLISCFSCLPKNYLLNLISSRS